MINRIFILRKAHGLSQKDFAKRVNVDQTAVSNWEKNKNNVDISTAKVIAKEFQVTTDYIYGGQYKMKRPMSEWEPDEIEDYNNAKTEDEKEYIKYKFGNGVENFSNNETVTPFEVLAQRNDASSTRDAPIQDLFDDLSDHGKGLILSAFKGVYLIEKGAVLDLPANLHKLEK